MVDKFNITDKWRERWLDASPCNYHLIDDPTACPQGFDLPRLAWVNLNRIRTGQGRCNACLFKWNLVSSAACDCGAVHITYSEFLSTSTFCGIIGRIKQCRD